MIHSVSLPFKAFVSSFQVFLTFASRRVLNKKSGIHKERRSNYDDGIIAPSSEKATEKAHFANQDGVHSFFGQVHYDCIISPDHFYRKLNDIIHWQLFTNKLIECYQGQGRFGRPPFNPAMILCMLFASYLHNSCDRQTEVFVNENLSAKYFVGLAVDQKASDHSTMTKFCECLLKNGKLTIFEDLLAEIVQIALESGVKFGSIQIMDSVHSVANSITGKDERRKKRVKRP